MWVLKQPVATRGVRFSAYSSMPGGREPSPEAAICKTGECDQISPVDVIFVAIGTRQPSNW